MTVTTTDTFTVNGVVLNTLAFNITSLTGRWRTAARRGGNVEVPGRHGTLRVANKRYGVLEVVLSMWVLGADEDGMISDYQSSRETMYANLDKLTRLFGSETLEVVHTLPDESQRQVVGEVMDRIDFTSEAGATRATFGVAIESWDAFWSDIDEVTASITDIGNWSVDSFVGATAPMDDLEITFTGPCNNPRLDSGSSWIQYNEVLTAGQSITLNSATWTLTGAGGLVPDYTAVEHGGGIRWFELAPGDPTPEAVISQTTGGDVEVSLHGRRKYMLG
jgi:hypothetical protein